MFKQHPLIQGTSYKPAEYLKAEVGNWLLNKSSVFVFALMLPTNIGKRGIQPLFLNFFSLWVFTDLVSQIGQDKNKHAGIHMHKHTHKYNVH